MGFKEIFAKLEELDQTSKYKEADDLTHKIAEESMKDDPCWEGYEMIGTKEKDGRKVPNCVKK